MSDTVNSFVCSNCDGESAGRYCTHCGQVDTDLRIPIRQLFGEFLGEIFALEGPLLATLRGLFLRPGFLTSEYMSGRRATYLSPVRLYLASSVVFGAALVFADSSFGVSMDRQGNSRNEWMRGWVWSVLIMMPVFAAMARAIPREVRYFAEHLVFSMHLHAFGFLLAAAGLTVVELSPNGAFDLAVFLTIPVTWIAYLILSARGHYGVGLGRALGAGLLLTVGYGLLQLGALLGTGLGAAALANKLGGAS